MNVSEKAQKKFDQWKQSGGSDSNVAARGVVTEFRYLLDMLKKSAGNPRIIKFTAKARTEGNYYGQHLLSA